MEEDNLYIDTIKYTLGFDDSITKDIKDTESLNFIKILYLTILVCVDLYPDKSQSFIIENATWFEILMCLKAYNINYTTNDSIENDYQGVDIEDYIIVDNVSSFLSLNAIYFNPSSEMFTVAKKLIKTYFERCFSNSL